MLAEKRTTSMSCPAAAAATASTGPVRVVEVAAPDRDALKAHVDSWRELAARAVEPNIFYEPANLLPALDTIATGIHWRFVFLYRDDDGESRLVGFFPFEERRRYKLLPIAHLRLFGHLHCFLRSPLLDPAHESSCLAALAEWVAAEPRALLEFAGITRTMRHRLERGLATDLLRPRVAGRSDRAFFRPERDAESYLAAAMPKKKRKELRRKLRRFAECGELQYRCLRPDEDATPWIDAFLALESQGWKGRAQSALACNRRDREYFRRSAAEAHREGKLTMIGYFLDGRPVALSCKYLAGGGAFAFKITFDEKYGRYSPGMLLELRYLVLAHENASIAWMDSCAEPDHFMANQLWIDRRGIDTLVVTRGRYATGVRALAQLLRAVARSLRELRRRTHLNPRYEP